MFSQAQLFKNNRNLAQRTASERVNWALETFGEKVVMSTSFGIQSAVMLHLVTAMKPDIPVIFIDTGYLFQETYRFADQLTERFSLNLKVYQPSMTAARQEALYGKLWEQGEEGLKRYGILNKVEPMDRGLKELGAKAWLTGLRSVQASTREHLEIIKLQNKTYKIHPIIDWSDRQTYYYLKENELPHHPLWDQGYISVGDHHSTSKLLDDMSAEQTRFGGIRRECGLHELSEQADFQI